MSKETNYIPTDPADAAQFAAARRFAAKHGLVDIECADPIFDDGFHPQDGPSAEDIHIFKRASGIKYLGQK